MEMLNKWKKIFCALVLCLLPAVAIAIPQIMSYQGKLNDKNGVPFNGTVTMTFSMYSSAGSPTTTALWSEPKTVSVENGIFSTELGSNIPFPDSLFSFNNLYLGIQVNADNEMTPRQRVTSGAFSFKSKQLEYPVPIGTIMAWAGHNTDANPNFNLSAVIPPLPNGWLECNGQLVTDPDSPLNGKNVPNLNSSNRFLRGSATSGATGGRESFSWSHRHSHGATSSSIANLTQTTAYTHGWTDYQGNASEDLKPPYYEVVWIIKVK